MVYCVAFGCNNRSGQNKIKNSILGRKKEKKWIRNISNHRAKWTPSKHSVLCQDHFTEEQFLISPVLASNIGYTPSSLRLKEDATPTLFAKRGSSLKPNVVQKRKSIAYQKRQNAELLKVTDSNIATKRHKPTSTTSTLTKDVEEEIYLPFMQTSLEYQGHDVCESQLDLQLEEVISSTTNHITLTQITAGALGTMACGAFGCCCLWTAIFPADVIKSRAQVQVDPSSKQGFVATLLSIVRKEGVRTLYQCLAPTLLCTVPATAGLFLAYEATKPTLSTAVYGS